MLCPCFPPERLQQAALEGVTFLQSIVQKTEKFHIADKAPGSRVDKARWDFPCETLDVEVWPQTF